MLEKYDEAVKIATSIVDKGDQNKITPYAHARALVSLAVISKRKNDNIDGEGFVKRIVEVNPNFTQKSLDMYIGQMKNQSIIEDFRSILGTYGLPSGE